MDRSETIGAGSSAPDFILPDEKNDTVSLAGLLEKGPVALLFVPSVWGMMCNVEMSTFRDMNDEFVKAGGQIVAVTTNSPMSNAPYKEHLRLPFVFLSDFDGKVSAQYGVLCGGEGYMKGRSNRAVFVVDKKHTVVFAWVADDPSFEPDYDRVLKSLQEVARH
ncbi:MAG TPA: redoxin domain-containing protein [Methanomassiliicoccales archaeon]|jgi:peroxiredoxin|nr:redoxin domain-containing protein [Methanomassiliicoccales archaeon]